MQLSEDERKMYIKLTNFASYHLITSKPDAADNFTIVFDNYIKLLEQSNLEQFWKLLEEITSYLKNYNILRPELFQQFMKKLISIRTKDGDGPNYFSITNITVYFFGDKIPIESSIDASVKFLNSWKKTAKEDDPAIPDCFNILIEFLSIFKGNVDRLSEQFLKNFNDFIKNWSVDKNKYSSDVLITIVKYITKVADGSSTFLTKRNFKTFMDFENILFQTIRKAAQSDKLFCSKCKSIIRHECINAVSSQIKFLEKIKDLNITDWCFMKDFKSNIRLVFLYMKAFKCPDANFIKNRFFNQVYNLLNSLCEDLMDEKKAILEILYKNQENITSVLNSDVTYLKYFKKFENSAEKKLLISAYIFILLSNKMEDKSREPALYEFIYYYSVWLKDNVSIIGKLGMPGSNFHGVNIPNYCLKEILYQMLENNKQPLNNKLIYCIIDDLIKLETNPIKIAKYLMFLPTNSSKFIDVQRKILKQLDSDQSLYLGVINYRIYFNDSREITTCDIKIDKENIENLKKIVVATMDKENALLIYLNDALKYFKNFIKNLKQNSVSEKEMEIAVVTLIGIGSNFHSRGFQQEAALVFGLLYNFSTQFKIEDGKLKSISYFAENYKSIPYFQHNFPNYDMNSIIKNFAVIVFNNIQSKTGEIHDNLLCLMNIAFFYIKNKEINSAIQMLKWIKIKLKETHVENNLNILEAKICWMEIAIKISVENMGAIENPIRLGRIFMNSILSISSIANSDYMLVRNLLFQSIEEFTILNLELLNSEDTSPLLFMMFKFAVKQNYGLMAVKILLLHVEFNLKHEIIDKSVVSVFFSFIFLFLFIFYFIFS